MEVIDFENAGSLLLVVDVIKLKNLHFVIISVILLLEVNS